MSNKGANPVYIKGNSTKRIKNGTKYERASYIDRINHNKQFTESEYATVIQRIEDCHPNASRISVNTWLLSREPGIRVIRKRQLKRAFRMQLHSINGGNAHSSGYYYSRTHSNLSNGLMPPGIGGYYVCSRNKAHKVYVLGPLYNRRCQVRGCNGKLKPI